MHELLRRYRGGKGQEVIDPIDHSAPPRRGGSENPTRKSGTSGYHRAPTGALRSDHAPQPDKDGDEQKQPPPPTQGPRWQSGPRDKSKKNSACNDCHIDDAELDAVRNSVRNTEITSGGLTVATTTPCSHMNVTCTTVVHARTLGLHMPGKRSSV